MSLKLKSLLKNSLIYSLSGITGNFIGIFLVPVYTRIFSPAEYGVIDLIATVTAFLNLFLIVGLDSAVGRYYVDAENNEDKKLTASTTLFYLIVSSFPAILILVLFSKHISNLIFGEATYSIFLTVALASIPFSVLFAHFQNMLKWRFQPGLYATTSVGSLLFQVCLTIYLVVFLRIGIIGIYIARLATTVIFSTIGFWLTRSSFSLVFSFKRLKELLYFGVPLIPLSLSHYIMTYSDRYFLRYFAGLDEVGLYGIGYRLASVISLLVVGFQHAWGPFVYSTYKSVDAKETFCKVYDYASILVCFAILALSLFSREILQIFTTQKYLDAYNVIPFIAASIAAYTFGGYFSFGIGIAKKNIHRAWGGGLAALINLALNAILIPLFGMIGAAVATIASFLMLGVMLMRISQRYYRIEYRFKANFTMYFITALVIFFAYNFLPDGFTFLSVCAKLFLLAGFTAIPFSLKLVGKKEINYARNLFIRAGGVLTS